MTWKRRVLLILGLTALALTLVTWLPLHPWDDEAVVIQREPDGSWLRQGPSEWSFSARLASSRASSGASSSTYQPPEPDAGRPPLVERIWILNLSESVLTRDVGQALQEDLLERGELTEVAYLPAHDLPLEVHRPPDLYVTLREVRRAETHLPGAFRLDAFFEVTTSRRPLAQLSSRAAERPGPVLAARFNHSERAFGLVTRAARYEGAVAHVRRTLALEAQLDAWRAAAGAPIPVTWAGPPPTAPDDLPWIDAPGARLIERQAPPPLLQEQTWIVPEGEDVLTRIESARDELEAAGWEIVGSERTDEERAYAFAAQRDGRLVEIYRLLPFLSSEDESGQRQVVVQHQARPTADEVREWFAERSPGDDALASLRDALRPEMRAALNPAPADSTPR